MQINYVVVCQAKSFAVFSQEDNPFTILNFPTSLGKVNMAFRTHYEKHQNDLTLPRQLYAEIHGQAPDLEDAIGVFINAANNIIPVLAFTTNAYVEDLEFEIVFNNTPNVAEREFIQSFIPVEIGIPKRGRKIDKQAINLLLAGIAKHPEQDNLMRSIEQYRIALSYWKPNYETFAVSHLFIAAEALKLCVLNHYLNMTGISDVDLAKSWGLIAKTKHVKTLSQGTRNQLEAAIRREIIF